MEPAGIATAAAQGLHSLAVGKTLINGLCSGAFQNFVHVLPEEVSQRNVSFMIQTAGDDRTIAEHTNLIPQAIAKYLFTAVSSGEVGPVKFVTLFQIDSVSDSRSPPLQHPVSREILGKGRKDLRIERIGTAIVPQPVGNQNLSFRGFAERKAPAQVFVERYGKIIGFKSMKRDIDLMQSGRRKQQTLLLFKQRAVGGQNDFETLFMCQFEESA